MSRIQDAPEMGTAMAVTEEQSKFLSPQQEELFGRLADFDFRFLRVKTPAGGATFFEVPADNETGGEVVPAMEGIIVYNSPLNIFYARPFEETGGKEPPDCIAADGKFGEGSPGGKCIDCPLNQFGSGTNEKGKMCKNRHDLYFLREEDILPLKISVPTGSINNFNQYATKLIYKGKLLHSVQTRISLVKATSGNGTAYAQMCFAKTADLEPHDYTAISAYAKKIKEVVHFSRMIASETVEILPDQGQET